MSYQQNQQKCWLPAKCPPQFPPQAPQAPSSCSPAGPPPASSCCAPTCWVSLVSYRFPRFYVRQPQCPACCENLSSGCSAGCHGSGGCN